MHVICYYIQVGCRFVSRKKGVRSPNLFTSISPKVQRKPWTRGEEKALVQFICLHDDRKSPSSTAVWPSMNPADPYWQEAAQYIHTTTGKSCLRTGKELSSCPLINSFFEFLVLNWNNFFTKGCAAFLRYCYLSLCFTTFCYFP